MICWSIGLADYSAVIQLIDPFDQLIAIWHINADRFVAAQWFYIALCGLLVASYGRQAYCGPIVYPRIHAGD
jgi:hypothetical protein